MIKYLFLYPISKIFVLIACLRNYLYDKGILKETKSRLPIISVGNIELGGTGKTPFVIALCQLLKANQMNPIIITRGYKRHIKQQIVLDDTSINQYTAQEIGDEPYYIKQTLPDTPIIISKDKIKAIKKAEEYDAHYIILDDGYQSRYVARDINIALINGSRPNQSFAMFPFGFLREPIQNIKRADFIYITKKKNDYFAFLKPYLAEYIETTFQIVQYNQGIKTEGTNVNDIKNGIAFCGISDHLYFFDILKKMNINNTKNITFNNHQDYNRTVLIKLEKYKQNCFITTYKDFVKLDINFIKKHLIYVVEMNFIISDVKLISAIKKMK